MKSIWDQDAALWGLSQRQAFVLAGIPIVLVIGMTAAVPFFSFFQWIIEEDSLIEWLQFVFVLAAARLFRFDLADMVIGSGAAIVGPAAAAGIAMAKGWKAHVTPGIAMGMLGKVIANFIGIAIFRWLS